MANIIPAILATTAEEYSKKISKLIDSGMFDDNWIQIDLMDNKFVQNKSIEPEIIKENPADFKLEAHLMVEDPASWIGTLKKLNFKRVVCHLEIGEEKVTDFIKKSKDFGFEVGIAINPETSVFDLKPFIGNIDLVLILGVTPGFSGQKFIPETLKKVQELFDLKQKSGANFLIEVDGGINLENAGDIINKGADNLVIGSSLFEGDLKENVQKIKEVI